MSMGSKSLPPPAPDELRRWDKLRDYGCICCRQRLGVFEHAEIHHLLLGGRRMGHRFTVGLCAWHHRGAAAALPGHTRALRGPSLMDGSKTFAITFGSNAELWAANDRAIRWDDGTAWPTSKALRRAAA